MKKEEEALLIFERTKVGHVARMGEERGVYRVLGGNRKERDH